MPTSIHQDQTLDTLRTVIRAEFNRGMESTPDDAARISTTIRQATKSLTHAYLGSFLQMQRWPDGSTIPMGQVMEGSYVTEALRYGAALNISISDLQLDNLGHYSKLALLRGAEVVNHKNRILFNQLMEGFTKAGHDGQPFFDGEHPVYSQTDGRGTRYTGEGVTSNTLGGSGDAWFLMNTKRFISPIIHHSAIAPELREGRQDDNTAVTEDVYPIAIKAWDGAAFGWWRSVVACREPLTRESFNSAWARMNAFVADGGDPLGIAPDLLVVGTSNRAAADDLLKASRLDSGSSNTNYGAVDLLVTPWINPRPELSTATNSGN